MLIQRATDGTTHDGAAAPIATVADRVGVDPLTLNDAWANAAGRGTSGGMHDSVASHNPQDPIVKLINEKNIKIEDFYGIQDSRNQVPYLQWARQMKNFINLLLYSKMEMFHSKLETFHSKQEKFHSTYLL